MKKTERLMRVISFVTVLTLMVGMIPISAITAKALGEVLKGTYYAEAGETTTVTCLGGAIYQQTHFSIDGFGIGNKQSEIKARKGIQQIDYTMQRNREIA